MMRRPIARAALAAAAAALAACTLLEPRPDTSRYFVLHPVAAPAPAPAAAPRVGLGPIAVAAYLRRPELLTRVSASELEPSESERWAEPLEEAVPRVLARDLAAALGGLDVPLYPWYREDQPDVQVAVDLLRFEREGDEAVLVARYDVRALREGGRARSGQTERRVRAASGDAAATVDALSAALAALAGELAGAVREIAPPR